MASKQALQLIYRPDSLKPFCFNAVLFKAHFLLSRQNPARFLSQCSSGSFIPFSKIDGVQQALIPILQYPKLCSGRCSSGLSRLTSTITFAGSKLHLENEIESLGSLSRCGIGRRRIPRIGASVVSDMAS